MKLKLTQCIGSFLIIFVLTACQQANKAPENGIETRDDLKTSQLDQDNEPANIIGVNEEGVTEPEIRNEIKTDVNAEIEEKERGPRLPTLEPTINDPIDVETLPFFQDEDQSIVLDPVIETAMQADTPEDCEQYEGKLKAICLRSGSFSPNVESYHEEE